MNGGDCGKLKLVMGGFFGIASPRNWYIANKVYYAIVIKADSL